jgi:nicotinamide-nucleotide amidase
LLGKVLTDFSGSSEFYEGGLITYSNALKQSLLGISPKLLESHGAVSREVALAMAKAVASKLGTKYSIATTGIAGPGGGTKDKPVGTIWCGFHVGDKTFSELYKLSGDRQDNRTQTVLLAINKLTQLIKEGHP